MAGTISPSFPIYVVENKKFGNKGYSRAADLAQQFGDFNNIQDIQWWRDGVAPHLSTAIKRLGGLNMNFLLKMSQEMGDESHNRNCALTSLFVNSISIGMIEAGVPKEDMLKILRWFHADTWGKGSGVRAVLGLAMACAKATLDPVIGIDYSTIASCMCRNGHEFGLRVAGLGTQWFTAPAPIPDGKYFPPYSKADSGRDMGDSAITETAGWGSFILTSAPGFLSSLPAGIEQANRINKENGTLTLGKNPAYPVPVNNFEGCPTGVDIRRVVGNKCEPWINTGITHKDGGHRVIGRGLVRAPLEAFQKAVTAFSAKYSIPEDVLLAK